MFSLVLPVAVDVGAYGKNSDVGIFSNLGRSLENGSIIKMFQKVESFLILMSKHQ